MVGLRASQLLSGQRKLLCGLDPNSVGLQLAIPVVGIPRVSLLFWMAVTCYGQGGFEFSLHWLCEFLQELYDVTPGCPH